MAPADPPFPSPLAGDALAGCWGETWQALALVPAAGLFEQLLAAWSEPQRRYHDLRHLGECLALAMLWRQEAQHPAEVALAIGEPGQGLAGWRFSHRQAAAALPIALHSDRTHTRYADVALLAG